MAKAYHSAFLFFPVEVLFLISCAGAGSAHFCTQIDNWVKPHHKHIHSTCIYYIALQLNLAPKWVNRIMKEETRQTFMIEEIPVAHHQANLIHCHLLTIQCKLFMAINCPKYELLHPIKAPKLKLKLQN